MRFSRWGIFFAVPLIKMQLERYDVVRNELRGIDKAKLAELIPNTAGWVEGWQEIYDSVKR